MIIYGTRSTELAKRILKEKCTNCETPNSIQLYVFQKYAHVFWIPLFPLGKQGVSQCNHCKQILNHPQFPASLAKDYKDLQAETKAPIWTFAGIVLIVAFIGLAMYNSKVTDELNAQRIAAPQGGDILEIKTKDNQYTLFKVDHVAGDSVFIQMNNYETNKRTGLIDLEKKEYSELIYGFSKAELKEMLQKGEILEIKR